MKRKDAAIYLYGDSVNNIVFNDLIDIELDGIHSYDYPDFVDAHVTYAAHPNGISLSDDELDFINDFYSQEVYELVLDRMF